MDYKRKRFKKSSQVVERLIDEEVIIVPVNSNLSRQDSIYNLDASGAKIWQMLNGKNTVAKIIDYMVENMDVAAQQAERDLVEFLNDLESIEAVEESNET